MTRSNEKGIALILALFMVLVLSTLSTSLMFVSQTETWSSQNYKMMSQARYAAESGIHAAANHLMFTYVPPGTNAGDPLAAYDQTVSPVTFGGRPVILSSNANTASNYPIDVVRDAFVAATQGTLSNDNSTAGYNVTARLMSMQQITSAYTGTPVTLQTWEITGIGTIGGARSAETEVMSVLERPKSPAYSYAAFATFNGCAALSFAGGATTDSYNSGDPLVGGQPELDAYGGAVGTNGNLTEVGNPTTINGSLSTPRSGVGACTANNVTAQTVTGNATVTEGLVELAQPISFPTPDAPNPLPPTDAVGFTQNGGCPGGLLPPFCVASANGATLTPAAVGGTVLLGNITTNGNSVVHLNAGTYVVNSIAQMGNSQFVIDSGPVIFQIAGVDQATPLTITGQGISNTTYDPMNLQFVYAGTGNISLAGGAEASALLYAPNATGGFAGGADWYGAVVMKQLTATGGAAIHYDRRLMNNAFIAGNQVMTAFTWKKS